MEKGKTYLKGIGIALLVLALLLGGLYLFFYQAGKRSLKKEEQKTELFGTENKAEFTTMQYAGIEYAYKENLVNILCLGVDKEEPMSVRNDADNSLGQADAIFLMSMDLEEKEIRMLAVPRDTMVTLQMYSADGIYCGEREGQITLQYGYGDGQSLSAELMKTQVSKLLCGIPIHAYLAVNVHSLWMLNDVIGGVDIVMDDDYTMYHEELIKGETVHLTGNLMENYLRGRDKTNIEGANNRMHRMKQYMQAFFEKAKKEVKKDMTLPLQVFDILEKNMVTSVTADEAVYLVMEAIGCSFLSDGMYTLPGENQLTEVYVEYRLNEEQTTELVLDLFYEEVK